MPNINGDQPPHRRIAIGRFTCNICGAANASAADLNDRERASCEVCQSSLRTRSVILALSRALFGMDLSLPGFPTLKTVRGLGLSDSDTYAGGLQTRFDYKNTFYHRAPGFDLSQPDPTEFGKYDFVICSEVLEHVQGDVDRVFQTLARLLKPTGVLILTVPYSFIDATIENFASLHETGLAQVGSSTVLVNRSASGQYEVFDRLVFHGGDGATLELRTFSEADLRAKLIAAGLPNIRFDATGCRKFGVVFSGPQSLPIVAAKEPFVLDSAGVNELLEEWAATRRALQAVKDSRWLRLGRLFGLGPKVRLPE
ncbi:MAG TPA: methyltransferase domain-containing protein [Bryobacteraceae bacterium]|nr:methyltransferase domain-containing protein [Bryobacteraceae bacterium]